MACRRPGKIQGAQQFNSGRHRGDVTRGSPLQGPPASATSPTGPKVRIYAEKRKRVVGVVEGRDLADTGGHDSPTAGGTGSSATEGTDSSATEGTDSSATEGTDSATTKGTDSP